MRMPVCVRCSVRFRVQKTGVDLLEKAGASPRRLWRADLLECPVCGDQIVARFANRPYAYRHQPAFEKRLAAATQAVLPDGSGDLFYDRERKGDG